jgi:CheY-like chemotaxis protein
MTFVSRTSHPPPSVLIACAHPDICFFFNDCLTTKGYEVETVQDGKTCFERIQQHAFSAVLLNYRLPDLDELFLLTAIRTIQPTLPVIITTAAGPSPVALQRGAFAVLPLPCGLEELYDTVQRAISPSTMADTDQQQISVSPDAREIPLNNTVLTIGLKPELRVSLDALLRSNGYDSESVETIEQALAILPHPVSYVRATSMQTRSHRHHS